MRLRAIPDSERFDRQGPVLPVCYCRAGISSLRFKVPSELSKRHTSASHGKYLRIPLQTNPNPTSPISRYLGSWPTTGQIGESPTIRPIGFRSPDCRSGSREMNPSFRVARHLPVTEGRQKLRKRKSLALPSTFSRIAGSGSSLEISIAPIIVEKIAKKARSLSLVRRPGINGTIRLL
jgi:hypothetical protein